MRPYLHIGEREVAEEPDVDVRGEDVAAGTNPFAEPAGNRPGTRSDL